MVPASTPAISVIIPLFNAAPFIGEAVQSVLSQTCPVSEILVVDDGSTDGSVEAVPTDPRVRVLRKVHSGIADTVNHGVRAATGEFLAFLDADDRWLPAKVERQLAALLGAAPPDLVFCGARIFHTPERAAGVDADPARIVVNAVGKGTLMLRRTTFERVGEFPVGERMHDFMEWYARALDAGLRVTILPDALYERRIHGANDGILRRDAQRGNYFGTLKKVLDRRRSAPAGPTT